MGIDHEYCQQALQPIEQNVRDALAKDLQ
jgi:hypothetical protein